MLTALGLLVFPGLLGPLLVMICLLKVESNWASCLSVVKESGL